jgi:hypothetical protein
MKTLSLAAGLLVLSSAVLVAPAAQAADLPPNGSFEATFFGVNTPDKATAVPTADGKAAWIFTGTYSYLNDAGSGFLHDINGRCIGMGSGDNAGAYDTGYCTYTDRDRDQIFSTFTYGRGAADQPGHGTTAYTGGTGKYAGLTGIAEFTGYDMTALDEGAPEVFKGHMKGTYKIQPVVGSK